MMRAGAEALWSHWARHPVQLMVLILGLAMATGLWTGVQAINAEARASYDRAASLLNQDQLARISHETRPLTMDDFVTLRRAGWLVAPLIQSRLPRTQIQIIGIDPFVTPPGSGAPDLSAAGDLTDFLTGSGMLFVAPGVANNLPDGLPPVRTLESVAPNTAITDITVAARLLKTNDLSAILVLPQQPTGIAPLADVDPAFVLSAPPEGSDIARLTDSFHLNLTAFGLLAFAVGLFIVHSAIGLAFEQRRTLFRTLRALGLTQNGLTGLLILECTVLATLGGLLGVLLGYVVAAALMPGVAATLSGLYGAGVGNSLSLSPVWWLTGFVMAYAGAGIAAFNSLWQLRRLPILAPAMPRAWARASGQAARLQGAAGCGLLCLALGGVLFGSGLLLGFVSLAALLMGAALLVPVALSGLLSMLSNIRGGAVLDWVWADTRQQIPGLSLALMALLLALSANVGVSTMVGSFRGTFVGWLDQRLASELYVTARTPQEASDIRQAVVSDVTAILPITFVEQEVRGAPADIYGIVDHPTYRDHWPLLDASADVWAALADGHGALVNEQLARREGLWTGQSLAIGGFPAVPVVGVYSDYGNPIGQVILGYDTFSKRYPDAQTLRFALRTDTPDAVRTRLLEQFNLPPENVVNQAQVKAFSLEVFEQTFLVTRALNVLTLGVAGFALWASLTTLGAMRLPQLAPVWALGLTRQQIAGLEMARALMLALLTAVLAVPVGLLLAWVLLAVVNVEAFGWRLPMQLFPKDWAWLLLWALIGAVCAAVMPMRRIAKLPPSELLKVFANAR